MHNIYTLRGTKIRDPLAWSKYLEQTIDLWSDRAEVMYGMHHWPVWGRDRLVEMLEKGRDAYRFINDETLRLANHGYTPVEIAELVKFPEELDRHWAMRGYYGTLNHNVKATYVRHLGWFDGNPATLHELPPQDAARRYVEYMGGADAVLERARASYEGGEYRWVAEVVNKVVLADPENLPARHLQADALEQLGYQSESGVWRNFYLTAAQELRQGVAELPTLRPDSVEMLRAMSPELLWDFLAVRLNGAKAGAQSITINMTFPDLGESYCLMVRNGALSHRSGLDAGADVSFTIDRRDFDMVLLGKASAPELIARGSARIDGDATALQRFVGLLDTFEFWFNIVTP